MALNFFKNKRAESSLPSGESAKCDKCHKNIGGLAFHCRHCGKKYCDSHRLPEDHNCKPFQDIHDRNKEKWQEVFSDLFGVRQSYKPKNKPIYNKVSEPSFDEENYEKPLPRIHKEINSQQYYNSSNEDIYNPRPFLANFQELFFGEYWNLRPSSHNKKYLELGIAFIVTILLTFSLIGFIQLFF